MTERWRQVPGYEGHYEVSDRGRVRSLDRVAIRRDGRTRPVAARTLKLSVGAWPGSTVAYLWRDGKRTELSVARLVYSAFVGPCPARMPRRLTNGGQDRFFKITKVA